MCRADPSLACWTFGARRQTAAVSRRFHRLFWSSPALWRELTLTASASTARLSTAELIVWSAAQHRLLQRPAVRMVKTLRFRSAGPSPEAPSRVAWAVVGGLMGRLLASLACPALESLDVEVWGLEFSQTEAAALEAMPALKHLALCSPSPEDGRGLPRLAPLRALPGLESLKLCAEALPAAAALGGMARLTRLVVLAARPLPEALGDVVSAMPALECTRLHELRSAQGRGAPLPDPLWMADRATHVMRSGQRVEVRL